MGKETVWVKNLKTGLVWLVSAEHAARLLESGEYERAKGAKGAKGERKGAKKTKGAKEAR